MDLNMKKGDFRKFQKVTGKEKWEKDLNTSLYMNFCFESINVLLRKKNITHTSRRSGKIINRKKK